MKYKTKLTNLPFTSKKITEAEGFKSATQGLRRLTKSTAISTAADNGAITAWWGNDNQWHAERYRYCATEDSWTGATKKGLSEWLTAALISIG